MSEVETYPVSADWASRAWVDADKYQDMYRRSIDDPDGFWREEAKRLDWIKPFTKAKNASFHEADFGIRWFEDGTLNLAANCLDRHLKSRGDQTAIIWEPDDPSTPVRTLTYRELHAEVCRFANLLKAEGVRRGDRVTLYLPMVPEAAVAMLACARIGAIHSIVFAGFSPDALGSRIVDCDSDLVITADEGLRGGKRIPLKANVDAALARHGKVRRVIVLKHTGAEVPMVEGRDIDWAEAVAGQSTECPAEEMGAEDPLFILYTSGSTGKPKGVMLSHANLWLGAVSVAHYLDLAEDDVTLAVLPLSFDYGQNQLFSAWYAGGSVVPLDYLTPRDVIKACARRGVTTLAAVPPLWVQLVEQDWPVEAVTPIRRLTNSGGALTVELVSNLRAMFPQARLFPMYGLTEAFRSTYLDPALVDSHPTSMGQAIPFAEILVVGADGDMTAADEEGELVHCGPLVAQGYWNDPARTAERFKPAPPGSRYGGTAVWSGDRVRRDAQGLLYFVGRTDAMIKSAGNRISPQEIEEAALASGLASEAAAIGVPDARLGQALHLFVRGNGDDENLRMFLKRELPNFMQPQAIRWVEAMPLNPNGKIDRTALAAEMTS